MSPALLPFFAWRHAADSAAGSDSGTAASHHDGRSRRWGANDASVEKRVRQDLLQFEKILPIHCSSGSSSSTGPIEISPIAARRIVSVTLILLRQSARIDSSNNSGVVQEENKCLVRLLDYLLETSCTNGSADGLASASANHRTSSTNRPSDYYMGVLRGANAAASPSSGWMIHLFLSFRDFALLHNGEGSADGRGSSSMDVDGQGAAEDESAVLETLMKWCCRIILHLATSDKKEQRLQQTTPSPTRPLLYQQGLALMACILFTSGNLENASWIKEELASCLLKVETHAKAGSSSGGAPSPSGCPILIHFLSASMKSLSTSSRASNGKTSGSNGREVPSLMASHAPYYQSAMTTNNDASSTYPNPWQEALRDTLSSREFMVLSQVLSHAKDNQTLENKEILTHAIPTILQYTLQHDQDLAVLVSFAAQGENITSWFAPDQNGQTAGDGATALAAVAAAAAYNGEDNDEESDDEQDDAPEHIQQQRPAQNTYSTSPTGNLSRADLLTLPKLDALYQTNALRAKKATVDRLKSSLRSHAKEVMLLLSLAKKIGEGPWIQQLGTTLPSSSTISTSTSLSSLSLLLPLLPLSSWQSQAQESYASALSIIMTTCSGIKAGRNAASPLLARLAFHDTFLYGLWERSSCHVQLLTSQAKMTDLSGVILACEVFSTFCDTFAHNLLAVNDDDFLERYHLSSDYSASFGSKDHIIVKDVVHALKIILNDLYWLRPVLASDITNAQNDPESTLRFQRARLLLSGTKLWNSLYERWCRMHRNAQFCTEDCWWFPQLASRGRHETNPIIHSRAAMTASGGNDAMDDSSVDSAAMDDDEDETAPMSANDAGGDALASTFRDPKMARVLTYIPQAMPFSRRVNLFNTLLFSDKLITQDETTSLRQMMRNFEDEEETEISGRERVTIRRDALYGDSKQHLNRLGRRLRKTVQVTFVNRHGQQEAGIDGGGVFKEFLDDLIKDAFLPQAVREKIGESDDEDSVSETHPDFFSVTPIETLTVNTTSDGNDAILSHYEFLGRVLGKSIYESILVEPQFCLPFLNKLLGKQNSLDDLKNLDPEYYRNLKSLRHMTAIQINDLGLTFELQDSTTNNSVTELMPGGATTPVTKENVIQYIHLVSHKKMNVRGSRQTSAFLRGFRDIIPAQWVRLFSAYELQKVISGDDAVKGIDVHGMMSVMRYSGGLHPSQPIIHWLWQVVEEMTPEQQRKFLKFMSSCSRQPLLGFKDLVPAPCIQQTRLREDDHGRGVSETLDTGNIRLPTSSTCMNLLKLPKYTSLEMLREKLLYAIEAAAGFELS